jgi:hypothetical protein
MVRRALACVSLLACVVLSSVPASGVPAAAVTDLVVWGLDAREQPSTFWIERGAGGPRLVAVKPGIVIAAQGGLWRWSPATVTAPALLDCGTMGPSAVHANDASLVEARLERLDGSLPRQVVVPAPREGAALANEYSHSVMLEGSVGPYLFVTDQAYVYDCGAHGNVAAGFRVWNAERARIEDIRAGLPARERRRLAVQVHRALEGRFGPEPTDVEHRVEARSVRPSRLAPLIDATGRLALQHAYYTDTCYACGDGEWDSYARSARVASAVLPRSLRSFAQVPEIGWLQQRMPGLRVHGVSVAPRWARGELELLPAGGARSGAHATP